jgi:hypothetical protein
MAYANHHIHPFQGRTFRQRRQALHLDIAYIDIGQAVVIDIVEMMMWLGIRIVEHARRIRDHLANQPLVGEQAQGIVDRRLGSLSSRFTRSNTTSAETWSPWANSTRAISIRWAVVLIPCRPSN